MLWGIVHSISNRFMFSTTVSLISSGLVTLNPE